VAPAWQPGRAAVGTEIVGTWRAKLAGKKTLDVSVTPFEPLPANVRAALDTEAAHLAAAHGIADLRLQFDA
jgi:hypothetical protein